MSTTRDVLNINQRNNMLGKGTYNKEHDIAHKQTGADSSILIVMNGNQGHGFSVKASVNVMKLLPDILRAVADNIEVEIEEDIKRIEAIKKGEQDAEIRTEGCDPQSFAG